MTDAASASVIAIAWIRRFAQLVEDNVGYLTQLDSAIGDADHGSNMNRGLSGVLAQLDRHAGDSVGELLRHVGMTLVSTVGGASGPLYGTFFMKAGARLPQSGFDGTAIARAMGAGCDGVIARGRAQLGDKTMVDAMAPAVDAFARAVAAGSGIPAAAEAAWAAAEAGRDATLPLIARKGRASYLGERSIGHVDPGAASTALMFQALAEALKG